MLTALIGPIANLAGTWLSGKVEEKKAQSATKVAKAQAEAIVMQKKATGEIDWDLEMAKGSQSSWKDEWLTILFSIPLILAFIPGMEEVVANGLHNSKLCQNGINILWGLSLLPHLAFVQLLSSLERNRRGRTYYGKNAEVEDTPPFDDVGNVDFSMEVVEWFMVFPDPTSQQAALVSVVTGAMTGAFAVWMGHEEMKYNKDNLIEKLIAHEGLRLDVYQDTLGINTIGIGRNLDDRGISKDELDWMDYSNH